MSNGTENFRNFQISGKKDNLKRLTEIFETSFRKFSVPLDFKPEFSEILVEWNAPLILVKNTSPSYLHVTGTRTSEPEEQEVSH